MRSCRCARSILYTRSQAMISCQRTGISHVNPLTRSRPRCNCRDRKKGLRLAHWHLSWHENEVVHGQKSRALAELPPPSEYLTRSLRHGCVDQDACNPSVWSRNCIARRVFPPVFVNVIARIARRGCCFDNTSPRHARYLLCKSYVIISLMSRIYSADGIIYHCIIVNMRSVQLMIWFCCHHKYSHLDLIFVIIIAYTYIHQDSRKLIPTLCTERIVSPILGFWAARSRC